MKDYQCVRVNGIWHATQEQAAPPPATRLGAFTICTVWGEFRLGYERRRPDCPTCLRACEIDEQPVCTCTENGLMWNWPEHQPNCPRAGESQEQQPRKVRKPRAVEG